MKKRENLSQSSIRKVEKLYQAVIELLEEGCDITAMKVSDITNRAGIGKGTAYEYFDNKEEIIANALKYDMEKQLDSLYEIILTAESFRDKVMETYDWIEKNLTKKSSGIQFFKAQECSVEMPRRIVNEVQRGCKETHSMFRILDHQIETALKEENWKEDMPVLLMRMALLSSYVEYFIYLFKDADQSEVPKEMMKEFSYQGIVCRLQKPEHP